MCVVAMHVCVSVHLFSCGNDVHMICVCGYECIILVCVVMSAVMDMVTCVVIYVCACWCVLVCIPVLLVDSC